MFKNLKNWYDRKIHILSFVYKVYKYRSKTEEHKLKLSESHIGQDPWNKDMKYKIKRNRKEAS